MKTALYVLPVLAIFVFLLVRAEFGKKRNQIFVFKPISTLLVIAAACLSFGEPSPNRLYSVGVLVGLALSFCGDLALMFPENRKAFTIGLGFFLSAHIAYAVVFLILGRFSTWDILSTALLAAAAFGIYMLLKPNLGSMKIPIIFYIAIISVMVSRAISTAASPEFGAGQKWMVAAGAVLFYISDVILAAARFWKPWKRNRISLAFYYGGQFLIALAASFFA